MIKIDDKAIIEALKKSNIPEKDIQDLVEEGRANKISVYEIVNKKHILPSEKLGELVAEIIEYPFISLSKVDIPSEVLEIVPENIALKQGVITFQLDHENEKVKIATTNPFDLEMINDIEKKIGFEAEVYYTTESNIKNIIGQYHQELKNVFLDMLPKHLRYASKKSMEGEKGEVVGVEAEVDEVNIIEIFDTIMLHAYRQHASDIHIEATKANTVIRYRIDGVLHVVVKFPRVLHESIMTRCKILSNLRIDETRAAQDGRISTTLDGDTIAFRVSILPTHFGEKIVMRLLVDLEDSISLIESGLKRVDYDKVIRNATKPYGMIIVTGPTGSGKTTTLYNILRLVNSEEVNIATIEDPIEYGISGINQVQVNSAADLTFAKGLRSLLRQDPDTILVGEMRDQETAQIAVESALTGHTVFSTLHANSAAIGIPRLIEMGIEPFLLTAGVNAMLAQRLVRKLCTYCLKTKIYEEELLKSIYQERDILALVRKIAERYYSDTELKDLGFGKHYYFYEAVGCKRCGYTGYKGRIGIYEVLEMDDEVKKAIMKNATSDDIEDMAVLTGMSTMLEDGIFKALSGITSLEEIIRVIKS